MVLILKKNRHVFPFVILECLSVIRLNLCLEYVTRSSDRNTHRFRSNINSNHFVIGISNESTVKLLLVSGLYCFLFDLILYVHSTTFQLCGTGLPGLNQY